MLFRQSGRAATAAELLSVMFMHDRALPLLEVAAFSGRVFVIIVPLALFLVVLILALVLVVLVMFVALAAREVAATIGTIPWEILTRITSRVAARTAARLSPEL